MHLLEGFIAGTYNRRNGRLGGYWQERYSSTAVGTGTHLWRCLTCVDLNMVRAGVVSHPRDWTQRVPRDRAAEATVSDRRS